jgi:predicted RNase H-like nuclease (RuvC/YqgF family)
MPKRKPPSDASASSGSAKRSRQSNAPPSDDSQLSLVRLQKMKNRVAKLGDIIAQAEERTAALQPLYRLEAAEARVEELERRLEESKSACRKAAKRRRMLQCVKAAIALLSSSRVCAGLP